MAYPLWTTRYVYLGTGISKEFTVVDAHGETIFSGTAVRPSGTSGLVSVDIASIASSVMRQVLPEIDASEEEDTFDSSSDFIETFTVKVDGTAVGTIEYYLNRSGDPAHLDTDALADPIRKTTDTTKPIIYSIFGNGAFKVQLIRNGSIQETWVDSTAHKGENYMTSFIRQEGDIVRITDGILVTEYKVVSDCGRYALYYVNAFGGWDSLIVDGRVNRMTDTYQRSEYRSTVNRTTAIVQQADRAVYANAVTRSWSLTTGWLKDDEAARMHHLFGSRLVYLFDNRDARFYPVVISSQSCEYKHYINDRRLISYEINVRLAQDITR